MTEPIPGNTANPSTPNHPLPSYLNPDDLGPWGTFLQQVDRVTPYLVACRAGWRL